MGKMQLLVHGIKKILEIFWCYFLRVRLGICQQRKWDFFSFYKGSQENRSVPWCSSGRCLSSFWLGVRFAKDTSTIQKTSSLSNRISAHFNWSMGQHGTKCAKIEGAIWETHNIAAAWLFCAGFQHAFRQVADPGQGKWQGICCPSELCRSTGFHMYGFMSGRPKETHRFAMQFVAVVLPSLFGSLLPYWRLVYKVFLPDVGLQNHFCWLISYQLLPRV